MTNPDFTTLTKKGMSEATVRAVTNNRKQASLAPVAFVLAALSTSMNSSLVHGEQVSRATRHGAGVFAELLGAAAPRGEIVNLGPARNDQSLHADAKPDGAKPV